MGGPPVRTLTALSMLFTTVVSVVVGVRLLIVAARTRRKPEMLFGVAFVCGGAGQAFGQIGQRLLWTEAGPLATGMNALCLGMVAMGTVALWQVIRHVFRPEGGVAGGLVAFGCLVTLIAYAVRGFDGEFAFVTAGSRGHAIHEGARLVMMSWMVYESTRHYRMLRRRLRLGLADPLATNQLLLWTCSAYATWMAAGVITWWSFGLRIHPLESSVATAMLVALMLVIGTGMWCAFFPPAALRRHITARAKASAAAAA